jgi:four helix bundle protein
MVQNYKDLKAWQLGRELVKDIYTLTLSFPAHEKYGLSSQMQHAVVSIPSLLAEGHARKGRKDFPNYVSMALGSLAELETQFLLAQVLNYLNASAIIQDKLTQMRRILYGLLNSLAEASAEPQTLNPIPS